MLEVTHLVISNNGLCCPMVRQYNVITVGETTIDAYMTLAHVHEDLHQEKRSGAICFALGDKIDVDRYDFAIGGNATNVAVGLTRLGLKTALCSETGDDEFSIKIRNSLATEGIERVLVKQTHGVSSFAVILNYKGDRTVFVQDAQREHDFDFLDVDADYVYLTSLGREWETPYKKTVDFVNSIKAKLLFNPGSRQMHEGRETIDFVLNHTDILFVNKEEGEHLATGKSVVGSPNDKKYIEELLKKLQELGPRMVVVTNGKNGSYVLDEKKNFYHQPMHPGEAVERTGAGDAFASGYIARMIQGGTIQDSMKWGSANAASVVSRVGAQAGLLKPAEMEKMIR